MKIDNNQNSEWGSFKLIPESDKELRSFIDYESKLLIVTESVIDISMLPSDHGVTIIPTEQFIVDAVEGKVLEPKEWKEYFNYEPFQNYSEDKKLIETVQRIHEPEGNTDSLSYKLSDEQNKLIFSNGTSVAFSAKPRETSIERYYENLKSQREYQKSLTLGEYSDSLFHKYNNELKEGDLILQYYNSNEVYELRLQNNHFVLGKNTRPTNIDQWKSLEVKTISTFKSISDFWDNFISDNSPLIKKIFNKKIKWYSKFSLRFKHFVIEKFIIEEFNKKVQKSVVPIKEFREINSWLNVNYNKEVEINVFWQFCSNCRVRVRYNPRYPNHACRKCVNKILDSSGNKLDYRDIHQHIFDESGDRVVLKKTKKEVKLFIEKVEYFASEARFGGIVHQIKE